MSQPVESGQRYFRRVFKIRAEDSPSVRYALREIAAGLRPSGKEVVPGVLSYREYRKRRATWDKVRQCIGLDAEFYEGSELLLFPPEWLNRAGTLADQYAREGRVRKALAVGIDPAEGGDKTAMVAIDMLGVIEVVSKQTPNTNVIPGDALAFANKHGLTNWANLVFDRGGGGKIHADRLRSMGYGAVRTIAFGEAVVKEVDDTRNGRADRKETRESAYEFKNRRAQMFGELSEALDPEGLEATFSIPAKYENLRNELSPFPKLYDPEGRLILPPKNKTDPDSSIVTLTELIGHSPDEADALALAYHAMIHSPRRKTAKAG
jgi:hypothetical protein